MGYLSGSFVGFPLIDTDDLNDQEATSLLAAAHEGELEESEKQELVQQS